MLYEDIFKGHPLAEGLGSVGQNSGALGAWVRPLSSHPGRAMEHRCWGGKAQGEGICPSISLPRSARHLAPAAKVGTRARC